MTKAYFNTKKTYVFGKHYPKGIIRFTVLTYLDGSIRYLKRNVYANLDGKTLRYLYKGKDSSSHLYVFELLEDALPLLKGDCVLLSHYSVTEKRPDEILAVFKTNDLPEI